MILTDSSISGKGSTHPLRLFLRTKRDGAPNSKADNNLDAVIGPNNIISTNLRLEYMYIYTYT